MMTHEPAGSPGGSRFAYDPPTIRHGAGAVEHLAHEMEAIGAERAIVVTGRTVGEREAVIDPIRAALGPRLAEVRAETTPKKRLAEVAACATAAASNGADVLVAVGGASSLDVARAASAVGSRDLESLREGLRAHGAIAVDDDPLPTIAVPTTLAGGSLSMLAGVSAAPEGPHGELDGGSVGDPRLMPAAVCYDPELVAMTPNPILVGSAMNGFSKGLETLYSSAGTPVTDATASRGLSLLAAELPALGNDDQEPNWERLLQGVALAQYGTTRADGTTFSVVHALGHALRVHTGVQLGVAHGAVAEHALAWMFGEIDGRRDLLASALCSGTPADPGAAVVDGVGELRSALGLPDGLRSVEGVERDVLDAVARTAAEGFLGSNAPPAPGVDASEEWEGRIWPGTPHGPRGLSVSTEALRGILEAAW